MKFFHPKTETPPKEKVVDNRTLLQLARQHLEDNEIKKAQQCCKKILRKHNKHYIAMVILAKSFKKSDEAVTTFEKAIEVKPDHPLAWQGLSNYYEGKEEESAKTQLLSIYDKILTLNIDEEYAIKTLKKYGELGSLLKNNNVITFFLKYMKVQENKKLKETAKTQLLQVLRKSIRCKNEDVEDVLNFLKNLNLNEVSPDNTELVLLGSIVIKNYDFLYAINYLVALEIFSKSVFLKKWFCEILCDTYLNGNTSCGPEINKHLSDLVKGIENTKYGNLLIAIRHYSTEMYENAYLYCNSALGHSLDYIDEAEAMFLINCAKRTPNRLRTISLCNELLLIPHLINPPFLIVLNSTFLICYMQEKDYYKALCYLKKIPIDEIDPVPLSELAGLYLELELTHDFTSELLNSTDYFDLFKAVNYLKKKQSTDVVELLLPYDKHPLKHYYLGLAYWNLELKKESLESLEEANKLLPDHPRVLFVLGNVYLNWMGKVVEARNCFERSYTLNKSDIQVVSMLSNMYTNLGLADLEFNLLQTAFKIPQTRQFWVCSKLGRICYAKGLKSDALIYLQAAVDLRPKDVVAQELIGDVYFKRKDYDRALVAYGKVMKRCQSGNVLYKSLDRTGKIFSQKQIYDKAIRIFLRILVDKPCDVEALKNMTINRIYFGLEQISLDSYHDARMQIEFGANSITEAMTKGIKELVCWRLYGDLLVFATRLPNEYSFLKLKNPKGETIKDKIALYKLAIKSYSKLIKFRDSCALFKCAVTYFEYFCETKNIIFCRASYNLAILFMKVNPTVWLVWDLLGKLCFHLDKCETAYCCFSKALSLSETTNLKSWCELGVFYLQLDKHQLENYKYVIEQFDLSTFAPTWLKEELSDTILNYIDALNVENVDNLHFTEWIRTRNTSSAEPEYDSPLESFKNVPNSSELIEWYLCFEEETASSCFYLGNLQENKGLYASALRYYDRAYIIAQDQQKNLILSQKGRVLMKMLKYEEAVDVYNKISERNLHDTCVLGDALYKIQKYNKSYATYYKALCDLCKNYDQKVEVLIRMSYVACRLIGVYKGGMLVLDAMKIKYERSKNIPFPFMKSHLLNNGNFKVITNIMSQYMCDNIEKSIWWYYTGLNFPDGLNNYSNASEDSFLEAICDNPVTFRYDRLFDLITVTQFYSDDQPNVLINALKALKVFPLEPKLWAIYVLSVYAEKTWPHKAAFLLVVIDTLRKYVDFNESLDKLLTNVQEDVIEIPNKK